MFRDHDGFSRRRFMWAAAGGSMLATAPRLAYAERLLATPRQSLGPFYPDVMPLDRDNDLVRVEGRDARALGTVTHVSGRVTDREGHPLADARVEIWQCDANGYYIHTASAGSGSDENFQGYGRTVTDDQGRYRFRTIRPVAYASRTPHIHFAIERRGFGRLVTQMYIEGEPLNERDFLLNRIRDPAARRAVIVPLRPADQLEKDALAGTFDIVLARG